MRMNSEPVFLGGIELMLDNLRAAMDCLDRKPGERVIVIPHQPSGKLLKALIAAARIEFSEIAVLNNLAEHGNSISCTIPTILARLPEVCQANGLKPPNEGDTVVLVAAGICMSNMSDEMSAGFACLRYQPWRPRHSVDPTTRSQTVAAN